MTTLSSTHNNATVIIGSGLGGLECARILASRGRRVVVLERQQQPGGCMQSYRRGHYMFDTGMHYIGGLAHGQSLHDAFEKLNLLHLPWARLDTDGFDLVTIEGQTFRLAEDYDNFVDTLAKDFPSQRDALQQYANMLRKTNADIGSPDTTQSLFETNAWEWLNTVFSDQLLVNVISGAAMKLELRKKTLPLFTFLHCNSSYVQSAWRLKGDGNQIVDSLINDIVGMGGEIVCNAEVTELAESDGQITAAVCRDGRRFYGDTFISDAHPAVTCSWLVNSQMVKKPFIRRMTELDNTSGMLTVSLVLKPHTIRYFNHNNYVYRHANVWDIPLVSEAVGGVMISCRVPDSAKLSPDGQITNAGELWAEQIDLLTPMDWHEVTRWSNTNVGRRGYDYVAMKSRKAEECIALAGTVVPGLAGAVEKTYVSTPLTYNNYTLTPQGSAFGIRKDYANALMTELSPRTPVPNLLLTGQSLILHGIEGVTMTSFETCKNLK